MRGLVHLYTGEGKGKTTAAIGLAVRASGRGLRVVIAQFLKGRDTGELHSLALLPSVTILRLSRDFGFFHSMSAVDKNQVKAEHDAMIEEIRQMTQAGECDMVVLDEIAAALRHELVNTNQVTSLIDNRPESVEIVMTGRDAPQALIDRADYITEMVKVRHPFDQGIAARKGIEW